MEKDAAGLAFAEEFRWQGSGPALLAGAAAFGVSAPWLTAQPAWLLALGLWLGYCAGYGLAATFALVLAPRRWPLVLGLLMLAWLVGAAAGWGLERGLGTGGLERPSSQTRLALHLAFCGLLMLGPLLQAGRRQQALRRAEGERARVQAELMLLQAQIEPHFLFNTLATLRSLVRQRSDDALPLLDRMTAFLEAVLPQVREPQSTLGRELKIIEHYLAIMALRMAPRLRWRIEAAPELHALPLPPLLLQPLVENAVLHGIEPCEAGGEIVVSAVLLGEKLRLRVGNDGAPLGQGTNTAGKGLALRNLADRLLALYGSAASFELRAAESSETEALLSLPRPA